MAFTLDFSRRTAGAAIERDLKWIRKHRRTERLRIQRAIDRSIMVRAFYDILMWVLCWCAVVWMMIAILLGGQRN